MKNLLLHVPLASLFLGTHLVAASPAPSGPSPTTGPIATIPGTTSTPFSFAHFDGRSVSESIVQDMAAREGDLARLSGWAPCRDEVGNMVDGCVRFTLSSYRAFQSYVMTDNRCPSPTASGCYGGYAIASLSAATIVTSSYAPYDATTTWTTRLGLRLPLALPSGTMPVYVLESAPSFTGTHRIVAERGSAFVSLTIEDAAGKILVDEGFSVYAFSSDGISCAQLGQFAEDVGHLGASYADLIVWANVLEYSATVGLVGGAAAGARGGPGVAWATLTASIGAGSVAADDLGSTIKNVIDAAAVVAGDAVEMGCELQENQENFTPETFDNNGRTYNYESSGSTGADSEAAAAMECNRETSSSSYDSETGIWTDTTCSGTWEDGVCTQECYEVCMLPGEEE